MKKSGSSDSPRQHPVRELQPADLEKGFLETLENLSDTEGLSAKDARAILRTVRRNPLFHVFVAVGGDGQVVGATTLFVEQKFIHGGGLVGHVEDVVVRKGCEGEGVGGSLVRAAVARARGLGCYKCILNCKPELTSFYEGLGFRRKDVGMRIDLKTATQRKRQHQSE
jgi:glucosamine-phosphate N-acetyltransferase